MSNPSFIDMNVQAQIAFGIALIVVLLAYIAFYKPHKPPKKKNKKS